MYSIVVCRLNDRTISGVAGVGAESISALAGTESISALAGTESISAPVSFLADMDRADMESAPTVVIAMIP